MYFLLWGLVLGIPLQIPQLRKYDALGPSEKGTQKDPYEPLSLLGPIAYWERCPFGGAWTTGGKYHSRGVRWVSFRQTTLHTHDTNHGACLVEGTLFTWVSPFESRAS